MEPMVGQGKTLMGSKSHSQFIELVHIESTSQIGTTSGSTSHFWPEPTHLLDLVAFMPRNNIHGKLDLSGRGHHTVPGFNDLHT